jgi:beta-lactamase regulating signal transducer with metallopeptidase domain
MESFFAFLVRASAGIMLFYMVYWLFLRNETFYHGNRWFLLMALVSAVIIPLFPLHYQVLVEPEKNTTIFQALSDTFKNIQPVQPEVAETIVGFGWQNILLTIYVTGAIIFLIRLLAQTIVLIHLMLQQRIKSLDGLRVVENGKYGLPFSFFNIVFINPKFHTQANLPEILAHEKVHIREFHWFDLLFTELLTVIFWFNPFIWMFEHAIKQNHEYLADQGVLAQGHSVARYQALLINQLMGMQIIGITNNLNFALNTNRFKMMTKMKTSRVLGIKFAWALPAIALLLFAFAEPEYKTKPVETLNPVTDVQKGEKEFVIKGKVVRNDNGKPLPGASVIIKGTTIGTVTNAEGEFTVTDPNPKVDPKYDGALSSDLVISFVGFETNYGKVGASGTALEDGRFTFKLKEGVIVINLPDYKNVPPPPPPPTVKNIEIDNHEEIFIVVEDLPKYPGGIYELAKYVAEMQEKLAKQKKIKGKVLVGFTIDEKGKASDITIFDISDINLKYSLDKENKIKDAEVETSKDPNIQEAAVAIVTGMKDWTPGKQRGKPVPVNYILPVEF